MDPQALSLEKKRDRLLDDVDRIEKQTSQRRGELHGDIRRLIHERDTLIGLISIYKKRLSSYEDIARSLASGLYKFGSDEYRRAKERAEKHFVTALEKEDKASSRLILADKKLSLVSSLEVGLAKERAEVLHEKEEIEKTRQELALMEGELGADLAQARRLKKKASDDRQSAEKLKEGVLQWQETASLEASEKKRQADEILDIIKREQVNVKVGFKYIKNMREILDKKEFDLKIKEKRLEDRESTLGRAYSEIIKKGGKLG